MQGIFSAELEGLGVLILVLSLRFSCWFLQFTIFELRFVNVIVTIRGLQVHRLDFFANHHYKVA